MDTNIFKFVDDTFYSQDLPATQAADENSLIVKSLIALAVCMADKLNAEAERRGEDCRYFSFADAADLLFMDDRFDMLFEDLFEPEHIAQHLYLVFLHVRSDAPLLLGTAASVMYRAHCFHSAAEQM